MEYLYKNGIVYYKEEEIGKLDEVTGTFKHLEDTYIVEGQYASGHLIVTKTFSFNTVQEDLEEDEDLEPIKKPVTRKRTVKKDI